MEDDILVITNDILIVTDVDFLIDNKCGITAEVFKHINLKK